MDDSEKLNELWSLSPLGRSNLIETPLLIIHAENDFRVPISEAEALFTSLKLQNKEVIFIRYPRDGHELSRSGEPDHCLLYTSPSPRDRQKSRMPSSA